MSGSSDLIQLRMKLIGSRAVVSETGKVSKSVQGLGKATSETANKQRFAERSTSRLTSEYKRLGHAAKWGLGILGASGVFAMEAAIQKTVDYTKATGALNSNLGFSVQNASAWAAVAHSRDIDTKQMSQTFGILAKQVQAAEEGSKPAIHAFSDLGISMAQLHHTSPEDLILRISAGMKALGPGTTRTADTMKLLGRGWQMLNPLLREGVGPLKDQLGLAEKYGLVITKGQKEPLDELIAAQRESKMAILGLQVAMVRGLSPAITAGEEQLQEFIATLNSPHLTKEQKISRISHQFLMLEDDLVEIIAKAIPHVAEEGGRLGVAVGGAVWHGFTHSDLTGKLVITAWLAKYMGGGALIRGAAGSVGRMIAWGIVSTLMPRLAEEFAVTGSVGLMLKARWANLGSMSGSVFVAGWALGLALIGFVLAEQLDKRTHFRQWGINAAEDFANGIIEGINQISQIGKIPGEMNPVLEVLGVDPRHIIPPVNLHAAHAPRNRHGLPSPDLHHPGNPFHIGGRGHKRPRAAAQSRTPRRAELMANPQRGGPGGRPIVIRLEHKTELDGKVVAESVAEHALDAAALA